MRRMRGSTAPTRRLRRDDPARPARRGPRRRADHRPGLRQPRAWSPAPCSSACPGSPATATTSPPTRSRAGRRRSSSRGRSGSACPRCRSRTCAPRWRSPRRASTATRRRGCRSSGITGTNGKTTTAFLVRSLLEAAGRRCGLLGHGQVGRRRRRAPGRAHDAGGDRPPAHVRARCSTAGDEACAMEISSHALELRRADGIHVAAAVFTNLTQDHLDFHPDDGGLLPGQAAAVRLAADARADRQRRRRVRPPAGARSSPAR